MQNVYGDELRPAEAEVAACYDRLLAVLRDSGDELPPFAQRNALKAVSALWHVCNGLDLEPEHIYDVGA